MSKRREEEIREKYRETYRRSIDELLSQGLTKEEFESRRKELYNLANDSMKSEIKQARTISRKKKIAGIMAGAVVAGGILTGALASQNQNGDAKYNNPAYSDTMPSENENQEIKKTTPQVLTYENANGEFQRIHNVVDVNYWACETVAKQLEEYNKANPNDKYNIDMNLISGAIISGIQTRESSLGYDCNKDNPNYQGPFSVATGSEEVEELNKVSQKLMGKNLIEDVHEDIQDPRIGAIACIYHLVQNYEYLEAKLPEGTKITTNMIVDSYLYGSGGVSKRIRNGSYNDGMAYSKRVVEYSEVFEDLKSDLDKNPEIRNMDTSDATRNAHLDLNEITERYKSSADEKRSNISAENGIEQ